MPDRIKRVLCVSPHFPPVNAPDHQRVRMALPYLREFGWDATVLSVKPGSIEGAVIDPLLELTLPADVSIHRVGAVPREATRLVGLGNLAMRALPFLWRAGNRLLKRGMRNGEGGIENRRFDLVFFST